MRYHVMFQVISRGSELYNNPEINGLFHKIWRVGSEAGITGRD